MHVRRAKGGEAATHPLAAAASPVFALGPGFNDLKQLSRCGAFSMARQARLLLKWPQLKQWVARRHIERHQLPALYADRFERHCNQPAEPTPPPAVRDDKLDFALRV